ncbi:MAG: DUF1587 domain-containing protein, partial [Novipirellula sp. JB048]
MARPPGHCILLSSSSMRRLFLLVSLIGVPFGKNVFAEPNEAAWKAKLEAQILPLMQTHCLDCHQQDSAEGDFDIQQYSDADTALKHIDAWERIVRRISLGEMPPEGNDPLTSDQKAEVQAWFDARPKEDLCDELASEETQRWYRGTVMSRRLTRSEYRFALEDLVGETVPDSISLPSDGSGGEGFDTN